MLRNWHYLQIRECHGEIHTPSTFIRKSRLPTHPETQVLLTVTSFPRPNQPFLIQFIGKFHLPISTRVHKLGAVC